MAIKVKNPPELSGWPKEVKCSNCGSILEIESYKDVTGVTYTQYNQTDASLTIQCPSCNSKVNLSEKDFTEYEVRLICQATSSKNATDYHNK